MRRMLIVIVAATALASHALAQAEPPIQGPQDAACRDEARARVFTAPNPSSLSLWDLGSQIYHTCMAAHHGTGPNPARREARF